MALSSPTNFTCGKTNVYFGESITCTWTAPPGNFEWYRIMAAVPNAFANYFIDNPKQTSYTIALDHKFCKSEEFVNGVDLVFSIQAGTGEHYAPTEQSEYDNFTLYVLSVPPSKPPSITVSDITQGMPAVITWEAATAEVGTIKGYTLQRSINGGEFETIYTGSGLTFPDYAVGPDWSAVQYRIQANGSSGNSGWTTSEVKAVLGGITLPPGGRLEQLENRSAEPVFPVTLTDGVFRKSDGRNLEQILAGMKLGVTGPAGRDGKDGKDGKDGAVGPAGPPGPGGLVEMETSIPISSRTANTLYGLILEKHS